MRPAPSPARTDAFFHSNPDSASIRTPSSCQVDLVQHSPFLIFLVYKYFTVWLMPRQQGQAFGGHLYFHGNFLEAPIDGFITSFAKGCRVFTSRLPTVGPSGLGGLVKPLNNVSLGRRCSDLQCWRRPSYSSCREWHLFFFLLSTGRANGTDQFVISSQRMFIIQQTALVRVWN
jgi:hypothetical protein